jgi:3-dehydroquinate dehydratase II
MKRVLVLNGPNLNLLGEREPEIYGFQTLAELEAELERDAASLGLQLDRAQSNHEGELIDRLQQARGRVDGVVLNPGGLSHTSVCLRDAVSLMPVPVILVHLSNLHAREPFRRRDLIAPCCAGVIQGLGGLGYRAALWALQAMLNDPGGTRHAGG